MAAPRGGRFGDMKTLIGLMPNTTRCPASRCSRNANSSPGFASYSALSWAIPRNAAWRRAPSEVKQTLDRFCPATVRSRSPPGLASAATPFTSTSNHFTNTMTVNSRGELLAGFLASPEQAIPE